MTVPPVGTCASAGKGASVAAVTAARPAWRIARAIGVSSKQGARRVGFMRGLEASNQRDPRSSLVAVGWNSVAHRHRKLKLQSHGRMQVISHARADALDGQGAVHEAGRALKAHDPGVVENAPYSQAVGGVEHTARLGGN